jgi:hypothetical protein
VWFIHGGREPDQVLVEWIKSKTVSAYAYEYPDTVRWGLTLWTQTTPLDWSPDAQWKGVAIPLLKFAPPGVPTLRVAIADVTGDGHPDVLVHQCPHTNHDYGPHEVIATLAHGTTWRIFDANLAETDLHASKGLLALDLPYYLAHDSNCCPSKLEQLRLRWNGKRYVAVSDRIVKSNP